MNLQAFIGGHAADTFQMRFVEAFEGVEIGDEKRISFELGGVVDELRRFPVEGANGKIIEADFDALAVFGGKIRRSGQAGGGHGSGFQEITSRRRTHEGEGANFQISCQSCKTAGEGCLTVRGFRSFLRDGICGH